MIIKKSYRLYIFFFLIFAVSQVFSWLYYNYRGNQLELRHFQSALYQREVVAETLSDSLIADLNRVDEWLAIKNVNKYKPVGYDFLIYKEDSLVAWSDQLLYDQEERINLLNHPVIKVGNTWQWIHQYHSGSKTIISLISIRKEYPYNNVFLKDHFTFPVSFNEDCNIFVNTQKEGNKIFDQDGTYLFSVSKCDTQKEQYLYLSILFIVFYIVLFFRIVIRKLKEAETFIKKRIVFYISIAISLVFYIIHISYKVPGVLFTISLFSPLHFGANILFSNLGSLLLFGVLVYAHAFLFYRYVDLYWGSLYSKKSFKSKLILFVNWLVVIYLWMGLNHIIIQMFEHSPTPSLVFKVTNLKIYGIIRLLISATLWLSAILVVKKLASGYSSTYSLKTIIAVLTLSVICALPCCVSTQSYIYVISFVLVVLIQLWLSYKNRKQTYTTFIWFVFLFSIYAVFIFYHHNVVKEREERKLLIENLSFRLVIEEDPLSELLLKEKEELIEADTLIRNEVFKSEVNQDFIEDYLEGKYFDEYLSRYDIQVVPCWPGGDLRLTQTDSIYNCYDYFDSIINTFGTRVLGSNNFYFLSSPAEVITYFGVFRYYNEIGEETTLYVELMAKPFFEGPGYPELLLTERERKLKEPFTHYSYGKYEDGVLVKQTGEYTYTSDLLKKGDSYQDFDCFVSGGYNHMIYRPDQNVVVILSLPEVNLNMILVAFSIIFIGFFIFGALLLVFSHYERTRILSDLSVQERIQLSIIGLMLVLLVVVAGGSVWQSLNRFEEKNYQILSEKTKSVLMELDLKIGEESELNEEIVPYITSLLKRFSGVFYTDINMYKPDGRLLATSRPELYNKGLESHLMNSNAFIAMRDIEEIEFIQYETIGSLKFLSAYVPFVNKKNQVLAYVNMPYFIGTTEIKEEVSSLIMGIMNFYLVFLIIVFALTVLISRRITYPLLVVQDKLRQLKLGTTNEKINYKWNDEIGMLVKVYNRMVDELSRSAQELAKTQREMAWREMAQQIAHEIKNPLTPMKLSIQYLEKAHADHSADFDQKLKRVSSTLIEQIEKLSSIASEFSNFAKMPDAKKERINMVEVIKQCVTLFEKEKNVEFYTQNEIGNCYWVYVDKKQMLSVFNNLIKNAIQAIPDKKQGYINVRIEEEDENIIIHIKDNGRGIPDEIKDKLFVPKFTTKSSGMGLGLAIVKNMVNINKGSIWFETKEDFGTTFSVKFPKYEEPN